MMCFIRDLGFEPELDSFLECERLYHLALPGVAQLVGHHPTKKKSSVQFQVRAHAWIVGLVPSRDTCVRQLMDVFLSYQCFCPSISPSLPLPLKINKYLCIKKVYIICFLPYHISKNLRHRFIFYHSNNVDFSGWNTDSVSPFLLFYSIISCSKLFQIPLQKDAGYK